MTARKLWTIAEYAVDVLDVPVTWVRDKVTAREIEFEKVGRHVRFSEANHEANLAAWRQPAIDAPMAPVIRIRRSA